jgi:hypothetical protein
MFLSITQVRKTKQDDVKAVLDRVFTYLDRVAPAKVVDKRTNKEIAGFQNLTKDAVWGKGDFRPIYYAWGITYAGCGKLAGWRKAKVKNWSDRP